LTPPKTAVPGPARAHHQAPSYTNSATISCTRCKQTHVLGSTRSRNRTKSPFSSAHLYTRAYATLPPDSLTRPSVVHPWQRHYGLDIRRIAPCSMVKKPPLARHLHPLRAHRAPVCLRPILKDYTEMFASTSHSGNATNDASVPSTAGCLATQCPAKLVTSSLASFDGPTALPAVPRGYLGHTSLVAFQLPKSLVSAVDSAWRSRARHVGEHWLSFRLSRSSWASDETP
jgi:hypothetical protein